MARFLSIPVPLAVGYEEADAEDETAKVGRVHGEPDAVAAQNGGQQEDEAQLEHEIQIGRAHV